MKNIIEGIFGFVDVLFEKIPLLNKLKGYRSVLGLAGMAVIAVLQNQGIGDQDTLAAINVGFLAFTGLALNAKGR